MRKFIIVLICLCFSSFAFADKWKSETTNFESKAQLKQHRIHKWQGLCKQNGLDLRTYPIWTDVEKAKAQQLWNDSISDYNERKTKLKQDLKKLSKEAKAKYFQEIGIDEQNEDAWLED